MAAHLIDVVTHEGIVRLTGITDNLLSRERAEEIALNLRGVRGVVNEVLISTPDVPDDELRCHVASALVIDPATTDYDVQATAADGVLTLTGMVQTWAEKELVLRVGRGVRGVRRLVADDLLVCWGEIQNSDEEISTQIRELLAWDIRVNTALVEVRVNDRVAHLSGTVGTAAEKAHVEATAYQAGASRVDIRDLVVAYWALGHELRRDKLATRPDADIAQAVREAGQHQPPLLVVLARPDQAVASAELVVSTAMNLLRHAPYPLLLVPAAGWDATLPRRLLLAVDGQPFRLHPHQDLLRRLLVATQGTLDVVHVVLEETAQHSPAPVLETVGENNLVDFLPGRNLHQVYQTTVVDGVLQEAARQLADMLVVVARPHSLFGRLFHESVTAQILRESPIPVLVLLAAAPGQPLS
ncbi:BON domain-containing protein [Hymenobacter psoromatis]|uniref:BON domain-containing protein n=1 Tax=Hymenobacter psoromatis TaxID=1484116 RepID=UPI001CBC292D